MTDALYVQTSRIVHHVSVGCRRQSLSVLAECNALTALQHRSRPAACIHTLAIRGVPLILLVFKPWLGWASILQRLLQHRHFGGLGKVIQIFIAFAMGRPPLPNAPNTSP